MANKKRLITHEESLPNGIAAMRGVFYATVDPRRKFEAMDSQMIDEDHKALANLPDRAVVRTFPEKYFKRAS